MRESMLRREFTPYGKDLKCQLVKIGMTQVELAEKVGTSKQYLGKILHGKRSGTMYIDSINKSLGLESETLPSILKKIEHIKFFRLKYCRFSMVI